jgi:hypothetical protein
LRRATVAVLRVAVVALLARIERAAAAARCDHVNQRAEAEHVRRVVEADGAGGAPRRTIGCDRPGQVVAGLFKRAREIDHRLHDVESSGNRIDHAPETERPRARVVKEKRITGLGDIRPRVGRDAEVQVIGVDEPATRQVRARRNRHATATLAAGAGLSRGARIAIFARRAVRRRRTHRRIAAAREAWLDLALRVAAITVGRVAVEALAASNEEAPNAEGLFD